MAKESFQQLRTIALDAAIIAYDENLGVAKEEFERISEEVSEEVREVYTKLAIAAAKKMGVKVVGVSSVPSPYFYHGGADTMNMKSGNMVCIRIANDGELRIKVRPPAAQLRVLNRKIEKCNKLRRRYKWSGGSSSRLRSNRTRVLRELFHESPELTAKVVKMVDAELKKERDKETRRIASGKKAKRRG